jgi:hypothetical protein
MSDTKKREIPNGWERNHNHIIEPGDRYSLCDSLVWFNVSDSVGHTPDCYPSLILICRTKTKAVSDKPTTELPYICKAHPAAGVRHTWNVQQYVIGGYPSGEGIQSDHRYFCDECGKELAAP